MRTRVTEVSGPAEKTGGRAVTGIKAGETIHPAAWGVCLFIFVSVGRIQEVVPFLNGVPLGKIAVLVSLLGLAMAPRARNRVVMTGSVGRPLLWLSVIAALSVGVSVWKSQSLEYLIGNFLSDVLLFFVIAKSLDNVRTFRFYILSLILSGVVLAAPVLTFNLAHRVKVSEAYDPNDLAAVLVTIMPFVVIGLLGKGKRLLWLSIALLFSIAVISTGSRGGFLGLLAVAGYMTWARQPGRRGGRTARLVLVGSLAVILIGFTSHAAWNRISTLTDLKDDYNVNASTGRLAVWGRGLTIMAHRPWGVGIGAFPAAEGAAGGRYKAAHNLFLQIGTELGVVGLLIFIVLALRAYRLLTTSENLPCEVGWLQSTTLTLRSAFIGFFITGFFLSHAYSAILYVLLAMATFFEPKRPGKKPNSRGLRNRASKLTDDTKYRAVS